MSCKQPAMVSLGGAKDASETTAIRGGIAEYVDRGAACGIKFNSYEARYRYLRGKSAPSCNNNVTFPCCTTTTTSCGCTS